MTESILIFLAIAALQLIAAYSKQKKEEAAKRAAPQPSYEPNYEEEVLETEEEDEEYQEFIEEPTVEELEFKNEGIVPQAPQIDMPFKSITDRKSETNSQVPILNSQLEKPEQPDFKLNICNPEQGILWIAILHEPRYKVKWRRK
jgi:hypothetical protein